MTSFTVAIMLPLSIIFVYNSGLEKTTTLMHQIPQCCSCMSHAVICSSQSQLYLIGSAVVFCTYTAVSG